MAKVIERARAHYDVQEVEYGKVYRWKPESVVIECGCGERLELTASETICDRCGADRTTVVQKELTTRRLGDEILHPWRYDDTGDREDAGIPF